MSVSAHGSLPQCSCVRSVGARRQWLHFVDVWLTLPDRKSQRKRMPGAVGAADRARLAAESHRSVCDGGRSVQAVRALLVAIGVGAWFWSQAVLGTRRAFSDGRIGDVVHEWSAPLNAYLRDHPSDADLLLIVTSALIDGLAIFLLASAIFGPTLRPMLGMGILITLRQLCQSLCALPPPDGIIYRHPGFPSLLVTYGTASDLFFSGHTAVAVYGAMELTHSGGPLAVTAGMTIALIEAGAVLVLRAHPPADSKEMP